MRKIKIKRENSRVLPKVIALTFLITSVVIAFVVFMNYNNREVVMEASSYLEGSAEDARSGVRDFLYENQKFAEMMGMVSGKDKMSSDSPFSYAGVADDRGNIITSDIPSDLLPENVSEESFFRRGKEESGYVAVPRRDGRDGGIVFYSPADVGGETQGVFFGYCGEERIAREISDSVFGVSLNTFLFTDRGDIISSSGKRVLHRDAENIGELLGDDDLIEETERNKAQSAIDKGNSYTLAYRDGAGKSVMRVEPVGDGGLYIMQSFPSSVAASAAHSDNNAGLTLEITFIVIFLIYMGLMIVINYRRRKFLVQQNRELGYIVKGMVKLFDNFVFVNFKNDTYKFLMNEHREEIPQTGSYDKLAEYIADNVSEDDRMRMISMLKKENIKSSMQAGKSDLIYEYRTADERRKWENLNIICLDEKHRVPARVLLVRQDVTGVKEEEERYRQALREAFALTEKANNAKSRFLSQISHDIRTPMNAIMGMTTLAMMNINDREKVKDCLDKISISSSHLLGIINKVLDMSEIESGRMGLTEKDFDLKELMRSLMAIFSSQAEEKKQDIKMDVDIVNESVIGDPVRLQQVFVNILGNAIKFTPPGGSISVRVTEKEARIQGTGYYEFVFEDNGIGMSEEFTKKIFEPFARENSLGEGAVEGSGLGMSIAGSIIQTMNGSFQVESRIGEGSRFTVGLDLKLQEEKDVETEDAAGRKEEGQDPAMDVNSLKEKDFSGTKALLVEDNELNMDIAAELLAMIGIETDKAVNGKEAVDKVREKGEGAYDMIFMDIQMPVMNGYEAAKEIRKTKGEYFSRIPIIAMSANAFTDDVEKVKEAGMNDYISKPVEVDKLIKAIETWHIL
ncbi:MAG TPA: response regulator [Candidatus Copromorpha excrementavium]|uniref:Stage 0 sporulation protein A homolog n=1 Tax=Candidatus Allocopromorpha excrementavium TaxID=2840741 RepID=A0A9D1HCJ0_9FIRM|nr:response regulator [Candidatus Copromorpha excrementavium]